MTTLFGVASVAGVTIICYVIGLAVKASGIDNKWIPVIVGLCGGAIGVAAFLVHMPEYPANDVITAIAVGIASGLSATGIDQIGKQLK